MAGWPACAAHLCGERTSEQSRDTQRNAGGGSSRADAARSEEGFATASNIGSENHADRRNTLAHTPSMQLLDRNDEMRHRIDDPFLRLWFRVVAPHRPALAAAPREARLRYADARAVMSVLR